MKKKNIITKLYVSALCAVTAIAILPVCAWSTRLQTQAAIDRKYELINQGYDGAVIFDQLYEEFDHVDGPAGTGGIDGLKLDGTPANGTPISPSQPSAPAHTHSWSSEVTKEATCMEKGEIKYTCAGCGESYTDGTPLTDHNFEATSETTATCVAPASVTFTCTVCEEILIEEKEGLAEHIYIATNDSFEATCEEAGHMVYVCNVCEDSYEETPEALGHDWSDEYSVDTKAGCTTEGMKSIHCKRCDIVKEDSEVAIEPMGHSENETHQIVAPTFWEDGSETITCKTCNEVIQTIILPATGGIEQLILPIALIVVIITAVIVGVVLIVKKKK
ncbi:MAG: hypothetical protein E7291_06840 [Lachnospiraceae bacterium]|nr:hypothetical protein [Lachnospiraceae bacterium]